MALPIGKLTIIIGAGASTPIQTLSLTHTRIYMSVQIAITCMWLSSTPCSGLINQRIILMFCLTIQA